MREGWLDEKKIESSYSLWWDGRMDEKIAFLNGILEEDVYMDEPKGFSIKGKEQLACKL